jgi:fatty-acyl-CoA synthase
MIRRQLLHFGEVVAMNAYLSPDKVGARDLARSLTFRGWNDRSCKLANALVGLGLEKGDRIAVLAYNCLEWMEIYAAVAKAALAVVPINFRLIGSEVRYIVENSEAKAIIVQDDLLDRVEAIRAETSTSILAVERPRGTEPMRTWSQRARGLNHRSKLGPTIPLPFSTRPAPPANPRA